MFDCYKTTHHSYQKEMQGVRYSIVDWNKIVFLDAGVVTDPIFSHAAGGLALSIDAIALLKKAGANISLSADVNIGFIGAASWNNCTGSYHAIPCYGPWLGISIPL